MPRALPGLVNAAGPLLADASDLLEALWCVIDDVQGLEPKMLYDALREARSEAIDEA